MAEVTVYRAEGIRADPKEVVGHMSLVSKPYAILDHLVFLFLLGESELDACCSLFPLLNHLCHQCWGKEPSPRPDELDIIATMKDLVLYQFHTSLLSTSAKVHPMDLFFVSSLVSSGVNDVLV